MSGKPQGTEPGGLTARQAEVADAIVKHGSTKLAARELGISWRTVENTMLVIKNKLGTPNQIRTAIAWDRLRRQAA